MDINDDIATQWWLESLEAPISEEKQKSLEAYLKANPVLANELIQQHELWENMANIQTPEPSLELDLRFEAMLGKAVHDSRKSSIMEQLSTWFIANWRVSLGSMTMGLLIGVFLIPKENKGVDQLAAEVQDIKQMLMLTMIEKPQAQERIKAVNLTKELPRATAKVTDALISTLNQDPSINVRLEALEALIPYGNQTEVRQALIQSITMQDSPLMQVALADAMVLLQEKSAVDQFDKVLKSEDLNESIRPKIQSTIETLRSI